jgi:long-chain fatty acid transport protein
MGILRYLAYLFLLLILLLPVAYGNGFTFDGIGVKARGMGGAFRAIADDWSAAYYNPAGYARLNDNMLAGNLAVFHNRYWAKPNVLWENEYENGFYNGQDIANSHAVLNVPQGGVLLRLPFWGEMVVGFSAIQTFDQNQNWQLYKNVTAYNKASISGTEFYNNLDVVAFQLTAARKFMDDKLSAGIGLSLLRADLVYSSVILRNNPMPSPISDRPYDKIPEWYQNNGNGWGFGYKAGILYEVNEKIDAALVYTGKSTIDFSGDADFQYYMGYDTTLSKDENYFATTEEYFFTNGKVVDINADFDATLDLPASVGGGIAFKPNDKLTLALDAEWIFWSEFKGFEFTYSNYGGFYNAAFTHANDSLFYKDNSVPVVWDDAGRIMLGADYKALRFLDLRGGFSIDQSPTATSTFIPQFIDLGTKYSYSFGFGFKVGFWNLDFATSYTHQPDLSVTDMTFDDNGLLIDLPADYRAENYQTILGISYRF